LCVLFLRHDGAELQEHGSPSVLHMSQEWVGLVATASTEQLFMFPKACTARYQTAYHECRLPYTQSDLECEFARDGTGRGLVRIRRHIWDFGQDTAVAQQGLCLQSCLKGHMEEAKRMISRPESSYRSESNQSSFDRERSHESGMIVSISTSKTCIRLAVSRWADLSSRRSAHGGRHVRWLPIACRELP
jgi:hypothetical protein